MHFWQNSLFQNWHLHCNTATDGNTWTVGNIWVRIWSKKYFIGKVTQLYLSFFSLFKEALCMGHSGGNAYCKTQDGAEKRAIRLHIFLPSRLHEFCSWTCVKYVSFALYFRKYMFLAYLISDVPWQERPRPQANNWNWIERIHRVDWSKIDVQSVSVSQLGWVRHP